jgi:hypothetical protein
MQNKAVINFVSSKRKKKRTKIEDSKNTKSNLKVSNY